jgi:hypothetical protein
MYYEGLRSGLRDATKVLLVMSVNEPTQEHVFEIKRYDKTLWQSRYARVSLVEARVIDFAQREAWEAGNKIVDDILASVDWDEFFMMDLKSQEPPDDRPKHVKEYTQLRG